MGLIYMLIFDSLVGYLVGMTLIVETILKPLLVRNGQKLIRAVDQDPALPDWVIPDFLHLGAGEGGGVGMTCLRATPRTS